MLRSQPQPSSVATLAAAVALSLLLPACRPKELRARRITAQTAVADLIGGTDATGGVGDWVLANGIVHAVVDDVGWQADVLAAAGVEIPMQTGVSRSGGALVDLGTQRDDNDQLSALFPIYDYGLTKPIKLIPAGVALGDPDLPPIVAAVDSAAGVASLTAYGRVLTRPADPLLDQPLAVRHVYEVRRGESFVRIRTEIENRDPAETAITTGIADVAPIGSGGPMPFVPWPGFGFDMRVLESRVPFVAVFGMVGADMSGAPAVEDGAREVSYTIAAPTDPLGPYMRSGTTPGMWVAGLLPGTYAIAPGGVFSFERRVYVGRRGDVDASARQALRDFAAAKGYGVGSLRGTLAAPDGSHFRASLEVTQLDLDPATPAAETIVTDAGGIGPVPVTQIRTDSSAALHGAFDTQLPVGRYEVRIRIEGRSPIGPLPFEILANATTNLGTIALAGDGALQFDVVDAEAGVAVPARLTFKGRSGPDPSFGAPVDVYISGIPTLAGSYASTPFGNTLYAATGSGEQRLPPGDYRVLVSRGPEYSVAWQDVTVTAGGVATAHFEIEREVDTSGWLAADFHVHAAPSTDSSVPPRDRIAGLAGEGVELAVSADHDTIFDYAPVIEAMGLGDRIASMAGTELTSTQGPAPFGTGFGHFNGWPLAFDAQARKNGAPEDDGVEPNVLYDRLRAGGARIVQMNHPNWPSLGFLATLGYDPLLPLTAPPNDSLLRSSLLGTGTRNVDIDAIEILNGLATTTYPMARDVWMSWIEQGHPATATAASDTHRIAVVPIGLPRTYVRVSDDAPAAFDGAAFDASLASMHAIGTNGPFVEAELVGEASSAGVGEILSPATGTVGLHVRVQAPCWIPVGDLRVFANGVLFLSVDAGAAPCSGALRFDDTFTVMPAEDTYYVVELEERLPRDTSSFQKQIATLLYSGMTFRAFTNPLFADVDGNRSFDPPAP